MYWDFNGWACNPVPGPQDAQRRVAIIVTTAWEAFECVHYIIIDFVSSMYGHWY